MRIESYCFTKIKKCLKHFLETIFELSPTQYNNLPNKADQPMEEEPEESADPPTTNHRKRTKHNNNHDNRNGGKRRRNKYDQIDQYDPDWRVAGDDMEEFVPMAADHRHAVPGGPDNNASLAVARVTPAVVLDTTAAVGGAERRVVTIVTLSPPRRAGEPVWALSCGQPIIGCQLLLIASIFRKHIPVV
jgi:hypothetical protein